MSDTTERTGFITADGLRMQVREAGAGRPLLFLHGFPQSSREWVPVMTALSGRARLIAPDLRGAGETEAPDSRYDRATVMRDLIALLDALGLDRVDLIAHDWGALVGFDLCLAHPERIRRYVAMAVPAPYLRMSPGLLAGMAKAVPHLWFQWAIAAPGIGPRLLRGGRQRLLHHLLSWTVAAPMRSEDVAAYADALRDPDRARAASRLYRQLILPAFTDIMKGAYRGRVLSTPTLVLFGAEDGLLPREALAVPPEDAPQTSIEFVPGAAHFLVDDNPQYVAECIARFVLE